MKNKLKYLLLCLLISAQFKATAQLTSILNVDPRPSPSVLDWASNTNTVILNITNNGSVDVDFKIYAYFKKNGQLVADLKLIDVDILTIEAGFSESFFVEDVIPSNAVTIYDAQIQQTVLATNKFPAGNYELCVELYDEFGQIVLNPEQCRPFTLTEYQPPQLMLPLSGSRIGDPIAMTFMWTSVSPQYPTLVNYQIKVFEVLAQQNYVDAVRFNQPILEEEVLGMNQLIWPLGTPLPDQDGEYVWQVRAVEDDISESPIGLNNGYSQIFVFHVLNYAQAQDSLLCEGVDLKFDLVQDGYNVKVTDQSIDIDDDIEYLYTQFDFGSKDWAGYSSSWWSYNYIESDTFDLCMRRVYKYAGENFTCETCKEVIIVGDDCPVQIKTIWKDITSDSFHITSQVSPGPLQTVIKKEWTLNNRITVQDDTVKMKHSYRQLVDYCLEVTIVSQTTGDTCVTQRCNQQATGNEDCNLPNCSSNCNNVSTTVYDSDSVVQLCGGFKMLLNKKPTGFNYDLSGTGLIHVPWLGSQIEVTFSNISINSDEQVCSGEVYAVKDQNAPQYPEQWGTNIGINWTKNKVAQIDNWLHTAPGINGLGRRFGFKKDLDELDLRKEANSAKAALKMPIAVMNIETGQDTSLLASLGITEMKWTNQGAKMNLIATYPITAFASDNLGFTGNDIGFGLKGPFNGRGGSNIELLQDQDIQLTNHADGDNFWMKFHMKSNGHIGNKIQFSGCEGYFCLDTDITFQIPRKTLIPKDNTKTNVEANVQSQICDWFDWIVKLNIPDALIPKTQEMEINFVDVYYDHSIKVNPPRIKFPEQFSDTTNVFTGFYAKNVSLSLPHNYRTFTEPDKKVTFGAKDLIIHRGKLTGDVYARNIINYPAGNISDLGMSVDTFNLSILENTITQGSVKGMIQLPIVDEQASNAINYEALWTPQNPDSSNYSQFTMLPKNSIKCAVLGGPDLTIDSTSTFQYYTRFNPNTLEDSSALVIDINGQLDFNDLLLPGEGTQEIPISLTTEFQGIGIDKIKRTSRLGANSNIDSLSASWGVWSFASPQKKAAGFNIAISEVKQISLPKTGSELYNGGVEMDVFINLLEGKGKIGSISAKTKIGLYGVVEHPSLTCLKPRFHKFTIKNIAIDGSFSAMAVQGILKIRNQDPIFGNGFSGEINIDYKCLGISTRGLVEFGNTSHAHYKSYTYFRAETDLILSQAAGIPIWPGLKLRGFSGGFARNMEMTRKVVGQTATYEFTPKSGFTNFKAGLKFANSAKEETYNFDADMYAQFSNNNGIQMLLLDTDFWVGSKMEFESRKKAKIKGSADVFYDFPSKHFNLTASVDVVKPGILEARNQNLVFDINGLTNKWYFKFGTPQQLNQIKVLNKANLYEYFMFGNDIPMPGAFTSRFIAGYNSVFPQGSAGSPPSFADPNLTRVGRGFAMGLGIEIKKSGEFKYILRFKYDLSAGAEANLSFLEYNNCVGLNNWRFAGSLGLYSKIGLSARARNRWNTIADIRAGARIQGQFPNPFYAKGVIDGKVKLFHIRKDKYLFNFSIHREFEKGNSCAPGSPNTGGASAPAEDIAYDLQSLIRYINPSGNGFMPTDQPFVVKYNLVPDEIFDLPQNQGDGSSVLRTFKMVINDDRQSKLITKDDQPLVTIPYHMMEKQINPIGEHLIVIKSMSALAELPASATMNPVLVPLVNPLSRTSTTATSTSTLNNPIEAMQYQSIGAISTGASSGTPGNQLANLSIGQITPVASQSSPLLAISQDFEFPDPLKNRLASNRRYELTLTTALKELINGTWVIAKDKNGNPITQTIVKTFSTGYILSVQANTNQGGLQPTLNPNKPPIIPLGNPTSSPASNLPTVSQQRKGGN